MTFVQTVAAGERPMSDLPCLLIGDSLSDESNYASSRLAPGNGVIGQVTAHWFKPYLYGVIGRK
jgi:hypothetical protein